MEKTKTLKHLDAELFELIAKEKYRQEKKINLIASENITSDEVLECLGSCLTNKYSEGQPGCRYYGGTEYIDQIEVLCQQRSLKAFHLKEDTWKVNVQALSGTSANLAVYLAFLKPHDRFMGLFLADGGHLSHGFYTAKKKISASSIFFESLPYRVNEATGLIDFDNLRRDALLYKPKLIVCGASAYPRLIDYQKFRQIADEIGNGCLVLADISHIAGLIAAGLHNSPFECCDIVTTTTHKTLRGPRSALIFVNIGRLGEASFTALNEAVFPGLQGGPHNNQIAAVACQMKMVALPEWKIYANRIAENAKALANYLTNKYHQTLVTGGTDTHMVLWDLRPHGITGFKLEKVAQAVGIYINRNTIPGDKSALTSSGVRLGTAFITSLNYTIHDIEKIVGLLMECVQLCVQLQNNNGKNSHDFLKALDKNPFISELEKKVSLFIHKRSVSPY